ncbi:uncharacterized transposon-derived protein F54H12.3 [Trichonephila clavipes]|nr:uncharacterized transposon-derived protein F54H12.3 [Trichonephila clavipes]
MNPVSRHVHLLHVLAAASPAQRKAILKSATDDQIKTLYEICDNLLSGNIPTKEIKKLCSYKKVIRLLANRSVPISRKQTLKDANYAFNDKNEFEVDGKPEYRSNVVDLFSYMMKNDQRVLTPPTGFAKFYAALRHVNIPLDWIERAHRTLRERLYRAFAYRNSYKYYDILPELVHSYNHSIHRADGFEPTRLTTDDEPELYKRLYHSNVDPQFSFTAGDIVRLSKARKTFRKGYLPG